MTAKKKTKEDPNPNILFIVSEDHIDHRAIKAANFSKNISIRTYADETKAVMQNATKEKKPSCLIINYADAHRKFFGTSKKRLSKRQSQRLDRTLSMGRLGQPSPARRNQEPF